MLLLRYGIRKTKEHILNKWGFILFHSKKNNLIISVQWVKSYCFDFIYYAQIIFLSKYIIILYIFKIFFTMLHLKIFLEYWIILYIFRISWCVTSSLNKITWGTCVHNRNRNNTLTKIKFFARSPADRTSIFASVFLEPQRRQTNPASLQLWIKVHAACDLICFVFCWQSLCFG